MLGKPFDVRFEDGPASPTLWLSGHFDSRALPAYDAAVEEVPSATTDLVVDISAVTDATVEGVEAIVATAVERSARGGRLVVIGRPSLLRHLLHLGLGDVLQVRGSRPVVGG